MLLDRHVEVDCLLERAKELDKNDSTDATAVDRQDSKASSDGLDPQAHVTRRLADRTAAEPIKPWIHVEAVSQILEAGLANHMSTGKLVLGRCLQACEARLVGLDSREPRPKLAE